MKHPCSHLRGCVLLALTASAALAQAPTAAAPAPSDEVIALPEFSVSANKDNSWAAAGTMSGTRTNVPIEDLPRSIQVLTSEFLADLGADNLSDAAAFPTGVTSQGKQDAVFDNNTFTVRGMRQNRHYRDGVKEGFAGMISDSLSVDRVESLRGPSSLLVNLLDASVHALPAQRREGGENVFTDLPMFDFPLVVVERGEVGVTAERSTPVYDTTPGF